MKSMKIEYPLKDVTFAENSADFNPVAQKPTYPMGLRICLNHEALKMLGISKLPELGSVLKMLASVEVISKNEYVNEQEKEIYLNMDLQITEMELSTQKKEVDASKMYASEAVEDNE